MYTKIILILIIILISACSLSNNDENLFSGITETDEEAYFIGSIDKDDWSENVYNSMYWGNNFFINPGINGIMLTAYPFEKRPSKIIDIYNTNNIDLIFRLKISSPFYVNKDSVIVKAYSRQSFIAFYSLSDSTNELFDTLEIKVSNMNEPLQIPVTGNYSPQTGLINIIPNEFSLLPAYPNPSKVGSYGVKLRINVPEEGDVQMYIKNEDGNIVSELVNGVISRGEYSVNWNYYSSFKSGIYRVFIEYNGHSVYGDIKLIN